MSAIISAPKRSDSSKSSEDFVTGIDIRSASTVADLARNTEPRRSISVILPAFNEEANVERAATTAFEVFSRYFEDIEIIIVDDGSTDETRVRLYDVADRIPDVVPKVHESNSGYGAALRTGIESASNELIFFTDSDLQFDLNEVEKLLNWCDSYDIVAGYRSKRADPAIRRFNAWGWNVLVRMVLGLKVKDIDCAFKLFHRRVFNQIKLESVGAMINTEILARARQNKMTIKEIPVSHFKREQGEQTGANILVIFKAFRELLQMRGKLKLGSGSNYVPVSKNLHLK